LLRKKSRQHGPNPYSAIRFHKGYVYEPIRYTVLTASQMTEERREMIASVLKTVTSGPEAMTLPEKPGWRTEGVGHDGRVYVVSYLGVEVAVFFKRQLTEVIPEPGEKSPEGVLQDPKEAWQRLDVLGRSAEKAHFVLTQQHRRLEESNKLLESRVKSMDDLNDAMTRQLEYVGQVNKKVTDEKLDLEKQLRITRSSLKALLPTPKPKTARKTQGKRGNGHRAIVFEHGKRVRRVLSKRRVK